MQPPVHGGYGMLDLADEAGYRCGKVCRRKGLSKEEFGALADDGVFD